MFPCIALIFHLPDADLLPEVLRFLLPGKSAVQIKQQGLHKPECAFPQKTVSSPNVLHILY